jgi:hypothetical protein
MPLRPRQQSRPGPDILPGLVTLHDTPGQATSNAHHPSAPPARLKAARQHDDIASTPQLGLEQIRKGASWQRAGRVATGGSNRQSSDGTLDVAVPHGTAGLSRHRTGLHQVATNCMENDWYCGRDLANKQDSMGKNQFIAERYPASI